MPFDPNTATVVDDGDDESRAKQSAFERNQAWTKAGPRDFTTKLATPDEVRFQSWVKTNNVPFDSGPDADYDMRGFWKALDSGDARAKSAVDPNDKRLHYPDYWKTPYHETFSNESQWADPTKAPKWNDRDQLVAPDGKVLFDDRARNQPESPVKPAFDPSTAKLWDPPKPDRIAEGLKDYEAGAHELAGGLRTFAERQGEDVRTGYADKPGYSYGEVLPFRQNDQTGEVEWGYSPESARAVMRGLGINPLAFNINDPRQRADLAAAAAALGGLSRAPGGLGGQVRPGAVPRTEPTITPTPRPGTPLAEAGIEPAREPRAGPSLTEAGITPAPEPVADTAGETVAVPQADGTVAQVKVATGDKPPQGPPIPPEAVDPVRVDDASFRAMFPGLTDEQFEALFHRAAQEVPGGIPMGEAATRDWVKAVREGVVRLAAPKPETQQSPAPAAPLALPAPASDPWAPVAHEPISPAPGTAVATAPSPQPIPASDLKPGDTVLIGDTPHTVEKVRPWTDNQIGVQLAGVLQLQIGPADAEVMRAPTPDPPKTPQETAHGGPWTEVGKNHIGDAVYENGNGVRAVFDNGVPWMESTAEKGGKAVPRNPGDRKRQYLVEGESWDTPGGDKAKDADKSAIPSGPAVDAHEKVGGSEAAGKISEPEPSDNNPAELKTRAPDSGKPQDISESRPEPAAEWTAAGENEDGQTVYANPQGVHSVVEDGVRDVEPVRLRPTRGGMAVSVPSEKEGKFRVVTPAADEPPDELRGAHSGLSGGRTRQDALAAPQSEMPAEEAPEELRGQPTGYKPRREYDKYLTNQAEIAANKLTVDALNGDIPEKYAVAGLGELARRGGLSEGAARVNLGRLTDWSEGEWEAAKKGEHALSEKPRPAAKSRPKKASNHPDASAPK